jgi:D-threo-aldose 1-dehydrogenase
MRTVVSEQVELRELKLKVSSVGFGCGGLMQSPSRKDRMAVLGAALDGGITHFDTARMYGLGMAEAELGRFLRSLHRETFTVATKFGIDVGGVTGRLARFQSPARAVLRRTPALRRAAKQQHSVDRATRVYDAAGAARSLDQSLAALGLDYVDIFFVHDPGPADTVATEELRAFFQRALGQGKIRAWGVAQDRQNVLNIAQQFAPEVVSQVRADLFDPAPQPADFAFGVLNRSLMTLSRRLQADARLAGRWREALSLDPLYPGTLLQLILGSAAAATRCRAILYSSTDPKRVSEAARAVSAPLDAEVVTRFLALAKELSPGGPT